MYKKKNNKSSILAANMTEGLLGTSFLHTATTSLIEEVDSKILIKMHTVATHINIIRLLNRKAIGSVARWQENRWRPQII